MNLYKGNKISINKVISNNKKLAPLKKNPPYKQIKIIYKKLINPKLIKLRKRNIYQAINPNKIL